MAHVLKRSTLSIMVALLALVVVETAQGQPYYRNPVSSFGCADPGTTYDSVTNKFYMSCTGGKFQINSSSDLVNWTRPNSFILSAANGGLAPWATPGRSWAPDIRQIGPNSYVSYFVQNDRSGIGAVGMAYSKSILGPYVAKGTPLVQLHPQGAIDPSLFVEPNTQEKYLIYKIDGNSVHQSTHLVIQKLTANGTNRMPGSSPIIIKSGGSKMSNLIEGSDLIKRGGYYYLFYSYGDWQSSYRVFVARSTNVYGPYEDDRLILSEKSGGQFYGPGHGTVVSKNGLFYYVYHAYNRADPAPRNRKAMVDKIYWSSTGWPIINNGHPSENPQSMPGVNGKDVGRANLTWNNPGLQNPTYTIDARLGSSTFSYIQSCVPANKTNGNTKFAFDGVCDNSTRNRLPLNPKTAVRFCAAENGEWGAGKSVCSQYYPIGGWNIRMSIPVQNIRVSWRNLGSGYTYSLDSKVKNSSGAIQTTAPCIDAGKIRSTTNLVFNRRCSNGKLVPLNGDSSLRICAALNNNWSKAICSPYKSIVGPNTNLVLKL